MRNYILLHGLNESLTQTWGIYLKEEIEIKLNGKVYMPELPKGHDTSVENWKKAVDELYNSGVINNNCIIIAHSLSTNFMISYLLEKKCRINGFIAVSGYSDYLDKEVDRKSSINKIITPFMNTRKQREEFSRLVLHRFAIYSNMDFMFNVSNLEAYALDIRANRLVLGFGGHFDPTSKVKEVPYIMEILKEINAKNRKAEDRVVYIAEEKDSESTIKKYKEIKEYLATKYRYVTTPLISMEHVGVEQHKFKRYTALIKDSELVIVDVSDSVDVGVEMMMAISMKIPTLVVAKSNVEIPDIILSAWGTSKIKRYKSTKELIDIIEERLK